MRSSTTPCSVANMKLSISVPDDLWEAARGIADDDSPSAVTQQALRSMVSTAPSLHTYALRPDLGEVEDRKLAAVRLRLQEEARDLYITGYHIGLDLAAELSYNQLRWIVGVGAAEAGAIVAQSTVMMTSFGRSDEDPAGSLPGPVIPATVLERHLQGHAKLFGIGAPRLGEISIEAINAALRDTLTEVNLPG